MIFTDWILTGLLYPLTLGNYVYTNRSLKDVVKKEDLVDIRSNITLILNHLLEEKANSSPKDP